MDLEEYHIKYAKNNRGGNRREKDRKSDIQQVDGPLQDMRMCEIHPTIHGYAEGRRWGEDKLAFIIRGNVGCGIWAKRHGGIAKAGRILRLNEDGGWAIYELLETRTSTIM